MKTIRVNNMIDVLLLTPDELVFKEYLKDPKEISHFNSEAMAKIHAVDAAIYDSGDAIDPKVQIIKDRNGNCQVTKDETSVIMTGPREVSILKYADHEFIDDINEKSLAEDEKSLAEIAQRNEK